MPPRLKPFDYSAVTPGDWAYLAGLIDGEGCICSSLPRNNDRPLRLRISMIHRPTIEWLRARFGGTCTANKTRQPNARQAWTWQISGKRTAIILRGIFPFLHAKQNEALVGLKLAATFDDLVSIGGPLKPATFEFRRCLGRELAALKREAWVA